MSTNKNTKKTTDNVEVINAPIEEAQFEETTAIENEETLSLIKQMDDIKEILSSMEPGTKPYKKIVHEYTKVKHMYERLTRKLTFAERVKYSIQDHPTAVAGTIVGAIIGTVTIGIAASLNKQEEPETGEDEDIIVTDFEVSDDT